MSKNTLPDLSLFTAHYMYVLDEILPFLFCSPKIDKQGRDIDIYCFAYTC